MPYYVPARSHVDRLANLKAAKAADLADFAQNKRCLSSATISRLGIVATYEPLVLAIATAEAKRSLEVSQKNAKYAKLLAYVRDYWEGLKRRTPREDHDASVLIFAGLPLSGDVPAISNEAAAVAFAKQIAKGDVDMIAAGFPAMSNPTAAQVSAARVAYENEQDDIAPADSVLDAALAAAQGMVFDVDDTIEDVRAEVAHFNRKLDDPSIRRALRRYGMHFATNPGEPEEDPADNGGTPPTPPPA